MCCKCVAAQIKTERDLQIYSLKLYKFEGFVYEFFVTSVDLSTFVDLTILGQMQRNSNTVSKTIFVFGSLEKVPFNE
jgi:hypothetical protein